MSEINVRADAVDVEQIMRQIRARIREKRGADYTEEELTQLATVKMEKFIDPTGLRSDLVEEFRRSRPRPLPSPEAITSPPPMIKPATIPAPAGFPAPPAVTPPAALTNAPGYTFSDQTIYETHRGPLRFIRRLLNPLLKLFFNPGPISAALHIQSRLNALQVEMHDFQVRHAAEVSRHLTDVTTRMQDYLTRMNDQMSRVAEHQEYFNHVQIQMNQQTDDRLRQMEDRQRERVDREGLYYELMHNITLEVTRMGIEVHNMAMRVESLSSRLEFDERRSRALEGVVQYRPFTPQRIQPAPAGAAEPAASDTSPVPSTAAPGEGGSAGGGERRRRRRRRRRRPGQSLAEMQGPPMNGLAEADAAHEGGEADGGSDIDLVDDGLDSSDVPDDSDGSAS